MAILFYLFWLSAGPALGYYLAQRRRGSVLFGAIIGLLTGPCLGIILIPALLTMFDAGCDERHVHGRGAGRSYSVEENPQVGDGL
jgi:hypothetical protein